MRLKLLPLFLLVFLFIACNKKVDPVKSTGNSVMHASGFSLEKFSNYTKLRILTPYPNSESIYEFALVSKADKNNVNTDLPIIEVPLKSIVTTSTTHIPMLESLGILETLIGFPNTRYISSDKATELVENGSIQELGLDGQLNTEMTLELAPEAIVAFSMGGTSGSLETLERSGIPIIYNGDWLETTPLGRAEWIKLFGALYNQQDEATKIFNTIVNDYEEAALIASKAQIQPTILSGVMFKDVWNLPAGESFVATFLKDANTEYLWKNTKGKGSLQLSFESVFAIGKEADLWIAPGHFETKEQLIGSSHHYKNFHAFKDNQVYTFSRTKGKNGGVLYYELGPTRPDLVLKDIIKIAHPELLPEYQFTFFSKMP